MNRKMIGIVILASMVSGFLGGMIAESWKDLDSLIGSNPRTFGALKADAIYVHSILLTDIDGGGFISLEVQNSVPELEMRGPRGTGIIRMTVTQAGDILDMYDAKRRRRSMIGWEASRKMKSTFTSDESFIQFLDKKGHSIWQAPQ